jgi:1-acyl-sn-glycerol-3-phosphate acyltransferase
MPNAFKRTKVKGPGIVICNHNHWIESPLMAYTIPFRTIISIISDVVLTNKISR